MARSKRLPITFKDDVMDYIENSSKAYGMSQSAFVNMCVAIHKQQADAMVVMKDMGSLIEKMEQLQSNLKGDE